MGFRSRLLISLIIIECAIGSAFYYLHSQTLEQSAKNKVQAQYNNSHRFIRSLLQSHSGPELTLSPSTINSNTLNSNTLSSNTLASDTLLEKALDTLTEDSKEQGADNIAYIRLRSSDIQPNSVTQVFLESRSRTFNDNFKPDKNLSLEKNFYSVSNKINLAEKDLWLDIAINLSPTVKKLNVEEQNHFYSTLGLLLGIALLGFGLFRNYGKGIGSLNQAVKALESGQLGYIIKQHHLAELRPTAEAFNRMSERLALIANEQNDLYRHLLQKDRRLELVLNSTDEGILGLNAKKEVCVANAAALKLLEIDHGQDINIERILPFDARNALAELYETQAPFHFDDISIINAQERFIPVELKASQIGLQDETFTIISLRNLSLEKRIQREVEQQNTLKAALMDASLDAILLMDNRGSTLHYNLSMFNLFNRLKNTESEISVLNILNLSPQGKENTIEVLENNALINTGIKTLKQVTQKNETLSLEFNIQAFEANGRLFYTLMVSDITQKIKNQERLEKAMLEADAANIAKSQFLAAMSHEIRTPLNGIHGSISLLANSELTKEQRELLHATEISSDALMLQINDILDFAKIEAGKMELERSEFSLQSILEEAAVIIGPKAQQKNLPIDITFDPSIQHCVISDAGRLRQICLNLLSNAVKFTETGSISIELKTLPPKNNRDTTDGEAEQLNLQILVKDQGVGIDNHKQALLFNEFTQANQSDSRRFGGSGLGLAISAKLAQLLGGYIVFSSERNIGSCFCLYLKLPITATPINQISSGKLDRKEKKLSKQHRILIVEDSITNQMIASRMLEALNQQAEIASNGLEALQAIQKRPFDLILMDLQMPEMNGYEATEKIRKELNNHQIPIIAMTANVVTSDKEHCFDVGMNDFLPKPVHLNELSATLQRWLEPSGPEVEVETEEKSRGNATQVQKQEPVNSTDQAPSNSFSSTREDNENTDNSPLVFSVPVIQQMEKDIGADRCQKMIDIVIAELDKRMDLLLNHYEQQELQAVGHQAHTLKSTSASFGLLQLSALSKQIEHDCRSEEHTNLPRLVAHLVTAMQTGQEALTHYKKSMEEV